MVINSEKVRLLLGLSAAAVVAFLTTNALYAFGLIDSVRFLWGASGSAVVVGLLALCREGDPEAEPRRS